MDDNPNYCNEHHLDDEHGIPAPSNARLIEILQREGPFLSTLDLANAYFKSIEEQ